MFLSKIDKSNQHCCGIYLLVNKTNKKLYVGETITSFYKRFHYYKSLGQKKVPNKRSPIESAIAKYGWNNFLKYEIEIINNPTKIILKSKELDYIILFNTYSKFGMGYNARIDYPDRNIIVFSEESRYKMGSSMRSKKWSDERRKQYSESYRRTIHHWYGKKHTKESLEKMKNVLAPIRVKNKKPVKQIDICTGTIINIFESAQDAAVKLTGFKNKDSSIIRVITKSKRKNRKNPAITAYGYKWERATKEEYQNWLKNIEISSNN